MTALDERLTSAIRSPFIEAQRDSFPDHLPDERKCDMGGDCCGVEPEPIGWVFSADDDGSGGPGYWWVTCFTATPGVYICEDCVSWIEEVEKHDDVLAILRELVGIAEQTDRDAILLRAEKALDLHREKEVHLNG